MSRKFSKIIDMTVVIAIAFFTYFYPNNLFAYSPSAWTTCEFGVATPHGPSAFYLPPGTYNWSASASADGALNGGDWEVCDPSAHGYGGTFAWGGGTCNMWVWCDAGQEGMVTLSVSANIWLANQAPWASDSYYTINEDAATGSVGLSVGDPDGNLSDCPTGSSSLPGTFSRSGCSFSFTPTANWNGTAWFDFYAADTNGATSAWRRAYITVNPVNDAPVATNSSFTTNEDTAYSATLPCTDVDGPSLTHSIVTQPANASVAITNASTGAYTFTPNANWNGSTSFTFRCTDGQYLSNTATMNVTVNAVNDAPFFTKGADQTFVEDSNAGVHSIAGWATGIGPGGGADEAAQVLSFTVTNNNNTLFTVQPAVSAAGILTFTTSTHRNGAATVSVVINDNGGTANGGVSASATQTFTITITPYNYTPLVSNSSFTTSEDTLFSGTMTGSDLDPEDTIQFAIVSQPSSGNGVVAITNAATGAYTYKPEPNWNGSTSFTFNVTDNSVAPGEAHTSAAATVSVTVSAVNDAPIVLVNPQSGG